MSSSDCNSVVWLARLASDSFSEDEFRVFVAKPAFVSAEVGSPFDLHSEALTFASSQRFARMPLHWLRQYSLAAAALQLYFSSWSGESLKDGRVGIALVYMATR